jgi:hypothetical protein
MGMPHFFHYTSNIENKYRRNHHEKIEMGAYPTGSFAIVGKYGNCGRSDFAKCPD